MRCTSPILPRLSLNAGTLAATHSRRCAGLTPQDRLDSLYRSIACPTASPSAFTVSPCAVSAALSPASRTPCQPSLSADNVVLHAITRDVLDSEVVGEALDLALRDLEQPATALSPRTDTLKNELARLDVELSRYAEAIADAGPLATILQAVKAREQRRDAIRSELKTLATPRRAGTRATSEIRAELVEYLDNWRDMARQGLAEARRLLRAVLVGRFVFTPVTPPPELPPRKGPGRKPRFIYELKGEATLSGLIAGLISASSVVAPTGFEPVFQP